MSSTSVFVLCALGPPTFKCPCLHICLAHRIAILELALTGGLRVETAMRWRRETGRWGHEWGQCAIERRHAPGNDPVARITDLSLVLSFHTRLESGYAVYCDISETSPDKWQFRQEVALHEFGNLRKLPVLPREV